MCNYVVSWTLLPVHVTSTAKYIHIYMYILLLFDFYKTKTPCEFKEIMYKLNLTNMEHKIKGGHSE